MSNRNKWQCSPVFHSLLCNHPLGVILKSIIVVAAISEVFILQVSAMPRQFNREQEGEDRQRRSSARAQLMFIASYFNGQLVESKEQTEKVRAGLNPTWSSGKCTPLGLAHLTTYISSLGKNISNLVSSKLLDSTSVVLCSAANKTAQFEATF